MYIIKAGKSFYVRNIDYDSSELIISLGHKRAKRFSTKEAAESYIIAIGLEFSLETIKNLYIEKLENQPPPRV